MRAHLFREIIGFEYVYSMYFKLLDLNVNKVTEFRSRLLKLFFSVKRVAVLACDEKLNHGKLMRPMD